MSAGVSLSFRVSKEKALAIDRLAEATDRSRSWVLEQALDAYFELQAWQVEHIGKGLEEARRGDTIPHDAVVAWLGTWGTDREAPPPK